MAYDFAAVSDKIFALQTKVDSINAKAKAQTDPIEKEIADLEQELMLAMQDAGLKTIKGAKSAADIKESIRIGFQDFAEFSKFARRKDALHLFQRRISVPAYNELKDSLGGKPIPGLSEFVQTKISVKKA